MSVKTDFGNVIRKIRLEKQLTQHGVALACDMSLRFYQDLEGGNKQPTITTIFRLCDAMDSAPDDLMLPVWKEWNASKKKS